MQADAMKMVHVTHARTVFGVHGVIRHVMSTVLQIVVRLMEDALRVWMDGGMKTVPPPAAQTVQIMNACKEMVTVHPVKQDLKEMLVIKVIDV